jgi:2,3,4,5-tetrahydropyridine-2-carboxylate N-succinyltransferase
LQAAPTIIEDHCFIGARSEIVEGVRVGRGAVISMGVFISASTPIYDREADTIIRGEVPAGAVVVAGSLPRDNGRYNLSAAIIVKKVDPTTRAKVSVNELLRNIE